MGVKHSDRWPGHSFGWWARAGQIYPLRGVGGCCRVGDPQPSNRWSLLAALAVLTVGSTRRRFARWWPLVVQHCALVLCVGVGPGTRGSRCPIPEECLALGPLSCMGPGALAYTSSSQAPRMASTSAALDATPFVYVPALPMCHEPQPRVREGDRVGPMGTLRGDCTLCARAVQSFCRFPQGIAFGTLY